VTFRLYRDSEIADSYIISRAIDTIVIPKDELKLVYDRFFKSDFSRGRDRRGTGLGLAIVKEIIKSHDENINVISTAGIGTEFTFSLPVTEAPGAEI
jgi:signal transduction histidine kinase